MAVSQPFGTLADGRRVWQYLLRNRNGMEISCISYGCRLTHFLLPVPAGKPMPGGASGGEENTGSKRLVDIILGYDKLAAYEEDTLWHGALLGRYAGRIAGGSLRVENRRYQLPTNEGNTFLHGCFSHTLFEGEVTDDNTVRFTAVSLPGEDGFPGKVWVSVTYHLTEDNELVMDYRAESNEATHLNLSNHSYFNLAGNQSGSAMNQLLTVNAGGYLELGEDLCPTGHAFAVGGGPFDFRREKPAGRDIVSRDPQLYLARGYDHCFILRKHRHRALSWAATLREPVSGRTLSVYTTHPGLQLYTGNNITGSEAPGKGGQAYVRRGGICFEAMHFPDSPNHPDFPSTLLAPGEGYHETIVYAVDWPV